MKIKPIFGISEMIGGLLEEERKKKKKTYAPSQYPKLGDIKPVRVPLRPPVALVAPLAPIVAPVVPAAAPRRGRPAGQSRKKRRTKAEMEFAKLNKMADSIAKREAKEAEQAEELVVELTKVQKSSKAKPKTRAQTEAERAALEKAEWEAFVPEGSPTKLAKLRAIEARLLGSPEPAPSKTPAKTPAKAPAKAAKAKQQTEAKPEELGAGRFLGRFE
jgi:hypothetical protein